MLKDRGCAAETLVTATVTTVATAAASSLVLFVLREASRGGPNAAGHRMKANPMLLQLPSWSKPQANNESTLRVHPPRSVQEVFKPIPAVSPAFRRSGGRMEVAFATCFLLFASQDLVGKVSFWLLAASICEPRVIPFPLLPKDVLSFNVFLALVTA